MANPFDQFDQPTQKSGGNPFDQFDAAQEASQRPQFDPATTGQAKMVQGIKDILGGAIRGAGSIGATILSPIDMVKDAIDGKGLSLESNRERRAGIDGGLTELIGSDPENLMYKGGKLGGEIAGTAGVPGVLAKVAQVVGAAPKIISALSSGGFKLGGAPATSLGETLANAAIRTGGSASVGAASAGMVNPEDAGTGAVIGAAMPGAVKVAGEAGKAIRSGVTNLLGATTGTSAETVRAAYDAGKRGATSFADNMRGNAQFDDVVATAKEGLAKMRQERGNQYRSGMVDIKKDKTVLDFAPIDSAMNRVISIGSFKGVQTNKNASGVVNELSDTIANWKSLDPEEYHTPEGLDALKRSIGDIRDSTQFGTPSRKAADAVYNAVKGEIATQAPTYSKVMGDYSEASKTLDEVTKALSLGDKASSDTAIRKLQSLMRNNAQSNYGNRLSLANQLEQQGGVSITPAISGQAMNSWTPRGMTGAIEKAGLAGLGGASIVNPALLASLFTAPLASPRIMGEVAYGLGKTSGGVGRMASSLAALPSQNIKQLASGAMRVAPILSLIGQKDQQ